jgi:hypothetical protein
MRNISLPSARDSLKTGVFFQVQSHAHPPTKNAAHGCSEFLFPKPTTPGALPRGIVLVPFAHLPRSPARCALVIGASRPRCPFLPRAAFAPKARCRYPSAIPFPLPPPSVIDGECAPASLALLSCVSIPPSLHFEPKPILPPSPVVYTVPPAIHHPGLFLEDSRSAANLTGFRRNLSSSRALPARGVTWRFN